MNDADLLRERDELMRETGNYREHLRVLADRMIEANKPGVAGRLYVLDRMVFLHYNETVTRMVPALAPPPAIAAPPAKRDKGKRAAKGQGEHRHKFDVMGACTCGAKRQRAPKGAVAERQQAIPVAVPPVNSRPSLGEYADDPFDAGTMGSSSTSDRR